MTYEDRVLKHVIGALLLLLLVASPAASASSASFGVKPNAVTIDANAPVAEFSFSSLSARATIFEVRVTRWKQTPEEDSFTPAPMMIVPAVFELSPYETRIIRIEPRGGPAQQDVEQSYRVTITEVVREGTSLSSARRFDAVLFIPPHVPSGEATFALSGEGKNAFLTVTNTSNRHVYLDHPRIEIGGKEIYRGPSLGYVLAKSTRSFPVTLMSEIAPADIELHFDDERGSRHSAALRAVR